MNDQPPSPAIASLNDAFRLGMKREIPALLLPPNHRPLYHIELGPGTSPVNPVGSPYTHHYGLPDWDGERDGLPLPAGSVACIYAFHFFEHLSGDGVIGVLRECERVLATDGVLNMLVPHRLGAMAFQDITHKTFWSEDVWKILFRQHTTHNEELPSWSLRVHVNTIIGESERNLALFTQLVKRDSETAPPILPPTWK